MKTPAVQEPLAQIISWEQRERIGQAKGDAREIRQVRDEGDEKAGPRDKCHIRNAQTHS